MITPIRSRSRPVPPGKPAAASARAAVSRASQCAGSVASYTGAGIRKASRSNRQPSISPARGPAAAELPSAVSNPSSAPWWAATSGWSAASKAARSRRLGGTRRNARRPVRMVSSRVGGSSASGNRQARPITATESAAPAGQDASATTPPRPGRKASPGRPPEIGEWPGFLPGLSLSLGGPGGGPPGQHSFSQRPGFRARLSFHYPPLMAYFPPRANSGPSPLPWHAARHGHRSRRGPAPGRPGR